MDGGVEDEVEENFSRGNFGSEQLNEDDLGDESGHLFEEINLMNPHPTLKSPEERHSLQSNPALPVPKNTLEDS